MIEQSESSDPEAAAISESSSFWSGPSTAAAAAAEEGRIRFIAFSHFLLQATRPDRSCCGLKLVPRKVATTTTKTSGHISRNELFYDRKVNVARMLSRRFNRLKGLCVGGLF